VPSRIFQPGLLEGQVAIVSGAGSGLGRAAALELAALGARVVVCGRRQEPLQETAERAEGGRVEASACDIREEEQVHALVERTLERHGRIDLLVNNAGGQFLTPAENITPRAFGRSCASTSRARG
jgi:citronellol/citronellal dehydrogenase